MLPSTTTDKKAGLAYWAARVLEECDKASAGFAADPVHDLRVAIRRCRSMADGFMSVDPDPAWKQMKRLAKPLFSALGELRDTQVMLEWIPKLAPHDDPLAGELSASLRQKESRLKEAAQSTLAHFDHRHWLSLNEQLATRTGRVPLEGLVFQHLALERWVEARQLHRRALRNRSGFAWHQLRIGIKRFRYTVENFLPQRHEKWSKDLRDLQDALGEVHDLDVLRTLINTHRGIQPAERSRWQVRIAEERQKRLHLYRRKMIGRNSLWELWRSELPSGAALEEAGLEKLRTWASFLDPDVPHSQLVAHLAMKLYDGLSQCGMLRLAPHARVVLQAAAFLHQIGRGKPANGKPGGHRKRAEKMVSKLEPPLGWSEQDIQWLGALVRYHCGPLPRRTDSHFVGVDRQSRSQLLGLIGVLRLANALDASQCGRMPELVITRKDGAAVILVQGLRSLSRAAERIARARYLLETVCRRPIVVRPLRARAKRDSRTARVLTRAAQASRA